MLGRHLQRALVLAILCCGGARAARADDAPRPAKPAVPDILEVAEETCLTRDRVGERLAPLLASTEMPEGLRITLRVDADGKATFAISVPGEEVGARTFDTLGLTCDSKLKVVAFAIAVAIEGIMESRAAKLRALPPPSAAPPSSRETLPPSIAPAPPRRGSSAFWAVGLGEGLFTTGLGSSATVVASVARDERRWGLRASLLQTLGATVDVDTGSVRYVLTLGRAYGCLDALRMGAVAGRACLFGSVGSFDAKGVGVGFVSRGAGRSPWVDAGAAVEADIVLTKRWMLRGSVAPFAILRAPTLRVTDAGTGGVAASSDVPRIGVLLSLEMALRFQE